MFTYFFLLSGMQTVVLNFGTQVQGLYKFYINLSVLKVNFRYFKLYYPQSII